MEGQMSSGIKVEVQVLTVIPIKGEYQITYKLDYGRVQSKWVETVTHEVHKS
jgi:hypothetical protein